MTIPLKSHAEALRIKIALYRAIKPFTAHEPFDPMLSDATSIASLSVLKDSSDLIIRPKLTLDLAERIAGDLGLVESDIQDDSAAALESVQKLVEEEAQRDDRRSTPFYNR